ncbi:hypothetical protein P153DRAFT_363776 [Dothidotthia symphoricarpi CBS 119687]|uniref:Uncharacterized protein n=1 Tax=Dothidotthia symphoricarpi CBS 119687 TaxID=1392245 RepID=A0A6A6AQY3_9PLEO|nr:uncharacterized protein P153DRAFT_363776 [Dothidotthia symphoricarpi CBS 119687]KAF2133613.1 hypothetical protein P153DRAFT_363776 [Dothidotthia symphoricarpi CBS 119687]
MDVWMHSSLHQDIKPPVHLHSIQPTARCRSILAGTGVVWLNQSSPDCVMAGCAACV